MDRDLADLSAVATWGTLWLAGDGGDPAPEVPTVPPHFMNTRSLVVQLPPGLGGGSVEGTRAWFSALRSIGTSRLFLVAGPSGGPHQQVLSAGPTPYLWTLTYAPGPTHTLRTPDYLATIAGEPRTDVVPPRLPVEAARERVRVLLMRNQTVAEQCGEQRWARYFDETAALLDEPGAEARSAFPDAWPADARRLVVALYKARSAFGGSGSWSDSGPRDEAGYAQYQTAHRELYAFLTEAWLSAVNGPDIG